MTTSVTYNGVQIEDCLTRVFRQEAVRDPSGTDIEYQRFTIRVFGLIHDESAVTNFGFQTLTGGDTIVSAEKRFRELLMQERKSFTMTVGGVTLLSSVGSGSSAARDVNNGPKPRELSIVRVTGVNAFHCEFEIEVCLVECATDTNQRGILNNRWSVEDSVDKDFRITRTIRGRMRVKPGVDIHNLRGVIMPGLESTFARESINVMVNETGLEMFYTVVDRQYDERIPNGATRWKGTHTQSTGRDGELNHVHFAIDVWGDLKSDKRDLITIATRIIGTRITLNALSTTNNRIIESIEMIDYMDEKHIGFRMTVTDFNSFKESALGAPVILDGKGAPTPLNYGAIPKLANLVIASLQSPCNDSHNFTGTQAQQGEFAKITTGGATSTIVTRGYVPDLIEPKRISDSHKQALYTHCKVTQTHHRRAVHAVLPIAKSSQGSGSSQLSSGGFTPGGSQGGTASASSFIQQQSLKLDESKQATSTVSVVQLALPIHYRKIEYELERVGMAPELPVPEDFIENGIAYVLVDVIEQPNAPRLMPDGKQLFSVSGKRVYVAHAPPPLNQGFESGSLPWDSTNTLQNKIPGSSYKTNIDHG